MKVRRGSIQLSDRSWDLEHVEGSVMASHEVPRALVTFAHFWLTDLGLGDTRCLLVGEHDSLPHPFSGSMKLYRKDGTCLELDTAAKPLEADNPYVREVRAGKFDLIVVSIAGWSLEGGAEEPCPMCGTSPHTALQHTILHELIHVAFPEYSAHNEWTDNKVRELLERASQEIQ